MESPPRAGSIAVGHPVDVASGVFFSSRVDLALGGPLTLRFERIFNTALLVQPKPWAPFGPGWTFNFDQWIHPTIEGLVHVDALGRQTLFDRGDIDGPGGRVTTMAGGIELEPVDANTLRLIEFGETRARAAFLFRRSQPHGDYNLVAIERSRGHVIEVSRDRLGRPTKIAHARSGRGVRFVYDDRGRVSALHLVNRLNDTGVLLSEYSYQDGRLVTVADGRGMRERFEYDAAGRMISELRRNGAVSRMRYDRDGRCIYAAGTDGFQARHLVYHEAKHSTEVTDSHGHVTTYEYNDAGQILRVKLPLDEEARFAYDELGRLKSQALPNGQKFKYEHDAQGHITAVTRPNGAVVRHEHDADHRLVAVIDGDKRTTFTYDAQHNPISVVLPGGATWRYRHDELGDCIETIAPDGARTTQVFDTFGDCVAETNAYGARTRFERDEWGQTLKETNPEGHARQYQYDRNFELRLCTDAEGRSWRFEPSASGNHLVRIDPTGRWEFHYNACGKVTEIVDPQGLRTAYVWDSEPNQLLEVQSPSGDRYAFEYDALGRVTKNTAWDGSTTRFEWKRGELVAAIDPLERRTEYQYDEHGRIVARVGSDESLAYQYGKDGRLASLVENGIALSLEYDIDGRIVSERQDDFELRRRYDVKGRLVWLGSALDENLLFDWDEDDRCTAINSGRGSVEFARDRLGRERVRRFGEGATLSFRYTPTGAVASQEYRPPTPALAGRPPTQAAATGRPIAAVTREFDYDAADRLSTIVDSLRGSTFVRHDCYGRLVATASAGAAAQLYTHDVAGNRRFEAALAAAAPLGALLGPGVAAPDPTAALRPGEVDITARYSYDRGNRVTRVERQGKTVAYGYDAAGFVVDKTVILADGAREDWHFTWNSHGRLTALTRPDGKVWQYQYDAAGRRVRKRGPDGQEIRYIWNGASILYVLRDGVRESTWINEPGTATPVLWEDDRRHYILTNPLGTPMEVVDAGGTLEWQSRNHPWGDAQPPAEAPPQQLLGQWHDEESGLNYNVYRYYDPEIGRYISPDPIGIRGGLNEYVGVASPFLGVDLLGLAPSPRDPGPFILAPQGANPRSDAPTGPTAYPSASGKSYKVVTDPDAKPTTIPISDATAAEVHTSEGPHLVAFNGTNGGEGSSVNGAHHADQVIMNHLVENAGDIPGKGPISVIIRGRDVCSNCASAIDGENGLGQQLANESGRSVIVEVDDPNHPIDEPRVFHPETPC